MTRPFAVLLALGLSACGPDAPAVDAAPAADPAAEPVADTPPEGPASEDAVCRALIPAVAEGDEAAVGFEELATQAVLDELTVDADAGFTIGRADMRVWTEAEGSCVMTAAFEEEFVLTVVDGRAVEIEVRPAQRAPVAYDEPDEEPDPFEPGYVAGEGVCETLLPVLRTGRIPSEAVRYRATPLVLETLAGDARDGQVPDDIEFYATEGREPGTCEMGHDAMGDAWYTLTLEGLDGDVGERAVGIRLATSYDEGP